MKKRETLLGILGLIIITAFVFFLIFVIKNAFLMIAHIASKLDAVVIVALITGAVSIIGVVLSSIVAKYFEYRQSIKRYLYEKRSKPYADFIAMVYDVMKSTQSGKEYSDEKMQETMLRFSKELTLWGSSGVIKKWIQFRELASKKDNKPEDTLFLMEDIIFEIRQDMGLPRKGLEQGDILAFFVNDIKEHLPM